MDAKPQIVMYFSSRLSILMALAKEIFSRPLKKILTFCIICVLSSPVILVYLSNQLKYFAPWIYWNQFVIKVLTVEENWESDTILQPH